MSARRYSSSMPAASRLPTNVTMSSIDSCLASACSCTSCSELWYTIRRATATCGRTVASARNNTSRALSGMSWPTKSSRHGPSCRGSTGGGGSAGASMPFRITTTRPRTSRRRRSAS